LYYDAKEELYSMNIISAMYMWNMQIAVSNCNTPISSIRTASPFQKLGGTLKDVKRIVLICSVAAQSYV
jgi:hypothetical protein